MGAPEVTLELLDTTPDRGFMRGHVRVTNRGEHTAWFIGYTESTPLYTLEQHVDGEWRDQLKLRCGFGLSGRALAAGTSMVWKWCDWVEEPAATRIGVEFSSMRQFSGARGAIAVAWSEPFEPIAIMPRER